MLHSDNSHYCESQFVTRGSRVSHAPPNHTLPAFLNLNGSLNHLSKFQSSDRDRAF